MKDVPFHPLADLFPLMAGDELARLAKDVKAHGLRDPIVRFEGMVLDGRNRYRACRQAGVEPRFVEYDGADPLAFVVSKNLHLTTSQAAACAARAEALVEKLKEEAKERQKRKPAKTVQDNCPEQKGQTRDQLGAMFGVSGKSVERARHVIETGVPKLLNVSERTVRGFSRRCSERPEQAGMARHSQLRLRVRREYPHATGLVRAGG